MKLFSGGTKCAATPRRWEWDAEGEDKGVELEDLIVGRGAAVTRGALLFDNDVVSLPCRRRGIARALCTADSRSDEDSVDARPRLPFGVRGDEEGEEGEEGDAEADAELRTCPSGRGMPPPVVALRWELCDAPAAAAVDGRRGMRCFAVLGAGLARAYRSCARISSSSSSSASAASRSTRNGGGSCPMPPASVGRSGDGERWALLRERPLSTGMPDGVDGVPRPRRCGASGERDETDMGRGRWRGKACRGGSGGGSRSVSSSDPAESDADAECARALGMREEDWGSRWGSRGRRRRRSDGEGLGDGDGDGLGDGLGLGLDGHGAEGNGDAGSRPPRKSEPGCQQGQIE